MYARSAIAFSSSSQTHRLPRLFHEERGGFFRSPNLRADLRSLGEAADSLPRGPPPYSVWCLFSTQPIHTCAATSIAMLDDFCVPEQFVLGSTLRRLSARGHPFRTHGRLYAGAMRVSGTPASKAGSASLNYGFISYKVTKRVAPLTLTGYNPLNANSLPLDASLAVDCTSNTMVATDAGIFCSWNNAGATTVGNAIDWAWAVDAEIY